MARSARGDHLRGRPRLQPARFGVVRARFGAAARQPLPRRPRAASNRRGPRVVAQPARHRVGGLRHPARVRHAPLYADAGSLGQLARELHRDRAGRGRRRARLHPAHGAAHFAGRVASGVRRPPRADRGRATLRQPVLAVGSRQHLPLAFGQRRGDLLDRRPGFAQRLDERDAGGGHRGRGRARTVASAGANYVSRPLDLGFANYSVSASLQGGRQSGGPEESRIVASAQADQQLPARSPSATPSP